MCRDPAADGSDPRRRHGPPLHTTGTACRGTAKIATETVRLPHLASAACLRHHRDGYWTVRLPNIATPRSRSSARSSW